MKTVRQEIRVKRKFSEELKKNIVKEYENGKHSILELSKIFDIPFPNIYNWVYKYSTYNKKKVRIVEMDQSSSERINELKNKIKELERMVGQKQIKIDYLEALVEVAQEDYGIELKKKISTEPLRNSKVKGKDEATQ